MKLSRVLKLFFSTLYHQTEFRRGVIEDVSESTFHSQQGTSIRGNNSRMGSKKADLARDPDAITVYRYTPLYNILRYRTA